MTHMRLANLLLLAWTAAAQVYVADDLVRVRPTDTPQSSRGARLKAARNEYAPFQIVVPGGESGLKNVNARPGALRPRRGHPIPARNLTLYRENYVEVKTPSPLSTEGPGWYPDALIPLRAGFDVEAGRNQVLWVDLFVPKDTAPGVYQGTVVITAENVRPVGVPVHLTVWNFTLPDTPSLRSNFGNASRAATWFGLSASSAEYRDLNRQFAEMLFQHRLCPNIPPYLYPRIQADGTIDPTGTAADLKEWMEHFHITGFPVSLQGQDPLGADRARNVRYLRSMYEYLKANGWEQLSYIYVLDEPNTAEAYEQVRQRAQFIHETQPGIKVLCTEQPTPQDPAWGTLVGSVDIWVPLWPLLVEADGAARLAAGEEMWSYTALTQRAQTKTPYWQLDFPLLNYRIPGWESWRYGMKGLLYWTTVYWDKAIDMWTNPLTFRNAYNLEGLLLYPSKDTSGGYFAPSMRLKQIREGIEDYEYFVLAAAAGKKEAADKLAHDLARSWTDWDTDPAGLYTAREQLARLIPAK